MIDERTQTVDIVFDGPPSNESGRFVEVETTDGESIRVGTWIDRGDGTWALRLTAVVRTDSAAGGQDVMRVDPLRARRHRSQGARRVFG